MSLKGLNVSTGGMLGTLLPDVPDPGPRGTTRQQINVARRAMACDFSLLFPATCPNAVDAGCGALDEIDRLDRKLSVYIGDSDVSYVNRGAADAPVTVDHELFTLLARSGELWRDTEGAFDIAAGALIRAWGFFRGPRRVPTDEESTHALSCSGFGRVALNEARHTVSYEAAGVEINLGSIGKGYAIDRALDLVMGEFGIASVLIQGGRSSLRAFGTPDGAMSTGDGWRVSLGDPYEPGRTFATVMLRDRALGTSGAAYQYFEANGRRYGHVLDPRTGRPAERLASASALAPTAAEADALATAFFVMGEEGTRRYCEAHPQVGAVLMTRADRRDEARLIRIGVRDQDFRLESGDAAPTTASVARVD